MIAIMMAIMSMLIFIKNSPNNVTMIFQNTLPKDEHHSQTEEGPVLKHDRRHDGYHVHVYIYQTLIKMFLHNNVKMSIKNCT